MKSTWEQLTSNEKLELIKWYDSPTYRAFKHLCQLEIDGLGKDALGSQEHSQTRYFAGEAAMAAKLPRLIREKNKESEDNKKKAQS